MLSTAERRTTISLSPPSIPRLDLQPRRPSGGARSLLDGGWWPRSADPVAELPGLILAVDDRHGPVTRVTRVMLRRADWDSHPRRLRIDDPALDSADTGNADTGGAAAGRVVRLGWFNSMPAGLLTAICADGQRTDLLTVPPYTQDAEAWAAMELAAEPGNFIHTPDLVSALTTPAGPTAQTEVQAAGISSTPENTWESEGGRLREDPNAGTAIRAGLPRT
jgi:hypothetical protein